MPVRVLTKEQTEIWMRDTWDEAKYLVASESEGDKVLLGR